MLTVGKRVFATKAAALQHYGVTRAQMNHYFNQHRDLSYSDALIQLVGELPMWREPKYRSPNQARLRDMVCAPEQYGFKNGMFEDPQGNRYLSIREMCKAHNICPSTFTKRVQKGVPVALALIPKGGIPTIYTVKQESDVYTDRRITSNRKKLPPVTIEQWGYDMNADAFLAPNGKYYYTRKEMCRAYKRDAATVSARLARGASLEEALTVAHFKAPDKHKLFECYGYDPEQDCYDVAGVQAPSVAALCKKLDIDSTVYKYACERFVQPEDAVEIARVKRFPSCEYPVVFRGTLYTSFYKIAQIYNVSKSSICSRLLYTDSFEEAMEQAISTWTENRYCIA